MLLLGQNDFSRVTIPSIGPLILMLNHATVGNNGFYHFNHQISFMFDSNHHDIPRHEQVVLELNAILLHNCGASFAGCAHVNIPSKTGIHDIELVTCRPIALSTTGTARGKMYDFYLGSSLDEITAIDTVLPSSVEHDSVTNSRLLSKHDIHTTGSGTIRVSVNITNNHFTQEGKKLEWNSMHDGFNSQKQRVFISETVDEILKRVRYNKRLRMGDANAEHNPPPIMTKEKDGSTVALDLSSQAKDALERARTRQRFETIQ